MSARALSFAPLRAFCANERGAVAVEFALIAPAFMWLTLGLVEVTMINLAQGALDHATSETARLIRTGEAQMGDMSEDDIRTSICDQLNGLLTMNCVNLHLDVESYPGFEDIEIESPLDEEGALDPDQFAYEPGAPSDIVLVRAYYEWSLITPYFSAFFGELGEAKLLNSAILFRNEPYENEEEEIV